MGIFHRGKGHTSDQKLARETAKRIRRLEKRAKGRGKPAGIPTGENLPKANLMQAESLKDFAELKQITPGWVPRFRLQNLASLKKGETVNIGKYAFVPIKHFLKEGRLCIEVHYGADLTSRNRLFVGVFEIDPEKSTIRRFVKGEQLL